MDNNADLQRGVDYPGITVAFYCHDGEGNFVFQKRSSNCRDEQGTWDCGGGGLHFGESLEEALSREMREEYGVVPEKTEYLGFREVHRTVNGKATHWIAFHFKAQVLRDQVVIGEPDKMDEIGWFKLDSLPEPLHSQIRHELDKYRDALK